MASGPEHDDETPSLASRVLDLLDDDLLGLGEIPTEAAPEPPTRHLLWTALKRLRSHSLPRPTCHNRGIAPVHRRADGGRR